MSAAMRGRLGPVLGAVLGLLGLLAVLSAPGAAVAQAPGSEAVAAATEIDYAAWEAEVARAESLIAAGAASTAFLQNLRSDLVGWRARFVAAEDANGTRIQTIAAQIAALGPPPGEGETEPATIADRRRALAAQLAEAQAPRLAASEARTLADGLIAELDIVLRDRQQQQLLELDPSPANPVNWPAAVTGLADVTVALDRDLRSRLADPVRRDALLDNAPVMGGMLVLGLLMLLRGRRWVGLVWQRLERGEGRPGRLSLAYLISLLQLFLSAVGLVLVLGALDLSGYLGLEAWQLAQATGTLFLSVFVFTWLAARLFPDGAGPLGVLDHDAGQLAAARRTLVTIGLLVGLLAITDTAAGFDEVPPAASGVFTLPIYIAMALAFVRFARLLKAGETETAEDEPRGFARRMIGLTGRVLFAVGLVGPVLAIIGYANAAEALMRPTALSVAVLAFLVTLQPVIRDLYALVFRTSRDAAAEALMPVLVNFALAFAILPVLGLIWGMRPDQLIEVYGRFWEGVQVGGARVTPGNVFAVILVFAMGYLATRLLQGALRSTVLPRTRLDTGARNAVAAGVGYIGIALAAVAAVTAGGIDLTALGFVLGALSVGIGFGLQNVVNNFVSGIILLVERPISEGDWIEVGTNMGIVKRISVRSTRIETFDRTDVIVPNADLISGTVTNWTRGNTIGRAVVTVGVAYGSDTRKVQAILEEIVRGMPDVAPIPEPGVDFLGFGADSLDFRVRAILRDVNRMVAVKTELHHRIAERFVAEGIEIPFAQRDIWLRNPEALRPVPAPAAPARRADADDDDGGDTPTPDAEDT